MAQQKIIWWYPVWELYGNSKFFKNIHDGNIQTIDFEDFKPIFLEDLEWKEWMGDEYTVYYYALNRGIRKKHAQRNMQL